MSIARAAPTSPAIRVSSTSSQDGPSGPRDEGAAQAGHEAAARSLEAVLERDLDLLLRVGEEGLEGRRAGERAQGLGCRLRLRFDGRRVDGFDGPRGVGRVAIAGFDLELEVGRVGLGRVEIDLGR